MNPLSRFRFFVAGLMVLLPMTSFGEVTLDNLEYGGWANCVRVTDGSMELIATTDVGPRIIRFGFVGGENLLREYEDQLGQTGGEEWRIYGGHRLWHAPEMRPRTYAPDNEPVKLGWNGHTLTLTQDREEWTAVQKELEIQFEEGTGRVRILHRIVNKNLWPIELSAWAITVFRGGGYAVLPRTPYGKHGENLLPAQNISLWRYTNMADPRFTWGEKFIRVRTDAEANNPQKIGILNTEGWGAYVLGDTIFVKEIDPPPGAVYPDLNANTEVYTQGEMLELETLSPMTRLDPSGKVDWVEHWSLHRAPVEETEESLDAFFSKLFAPKEEPTP